MEQVIIHGVLSVVFMLYLITYVKVCRNERRIIIILVAYNGSVMSLYVATCYYLGLYA